MNFLEKFKGKTHLLGKDGVSGLHTQNSTPIAKPIPKYSMSPSPKPQMKNAKPQRNFSSQSEKLKPVSNLNNDFRRQKTKPDETQSEQISIRTTPIQSSQKLLSYNSEKGIEKGGMKALIKRKDFISIDKKNEKVENVQKIGENLKIKPLRNRDLIFIKENEKKSNVKNSDVLRDIKKLNKNSKSTAKIDNNIGFSVIRESNEDKEEDFEELERRHLAFLNEIEKKNYK